MLQYRARGNEIVDASGRQLAVVLATNCTKKLATAMAGAAAKEANQIATERQRLSSAKVPARKIAVAKAATSRRKAPAAARSRCMEVEMGGSFTCPAGGCCRPGMCGRDE